MKRVSILIAAALMFTLVSCDNSNKKNTSAHTDSKQNTNITKTDHIMA